MSPKDKPLVWLHGQVKTPPFSAAARLEAGYLLQRNYWGRGLGTEVLQSLLTYGLEKINLQQIIAVTHPDNKASIKIMEKCGQESRNNIGEWCCE